MHLLTPSLQATRLCNAVVDYLSTTFALADAEPRRALGEFLLDESDGIFTGPYIRLRLPYRPADGDWQSALDWTPPFPPYRHQAQAYRQLTTKDLGPDKPRPVPTLVTTGTGSGKTEAFLHPILDHVLRSRRDGVGGIKALILYPMNALATDQADRLTRLLTTDPRLSTVTAGIYTGDAASERTKVGPAGLITSRQALRSDPPDILLTNYKMLDQLLLRPDDQPLWAASARSLTYLVLDEFHTYDGAQGTDVAVLLRRLGMALRSHLPDDHPDHEEFARRPLGRVTPVATSATLGDGTPDPMCDFARDVFGERPDPQDVVTEQRLDVEEWSAQARTDIAEAGFTPRPFGTLLLADLHDLARLSTTHADDAAELTRQVTHVLYEVEPSNGHRPDDDALLRAHPGIRDLITAAEQAVPLDSLLQALPRDLVTDHVEVARAALATVLAALSHVRVTVGRGAVSVELTLWIREVSRVDRTLTPAAGFRWADDGELADIEGVPVAALPAAYCRSCGRSGWMARLAATGRDLADDDSKIRTARATRDPRTRMLVHAPGEDVAAAATPPTEPLRWLHVTRRTLLTTRPPDDDPDRLAGNLLPVLVHDGPDAEDASRREECPSCARPDATRFLGSAVATLLSVSLSTLFSDPHLDSAEKRALVFTDSVQDAAHRAGFVTHRSHTVTLRTALRSALTRPMDLAAWVEETLRAAEDDPFARYLLVPSDLVDIGVFQEYWSTPAGRRVPVEAVTGVRRRLLLDAELEVGLQSGYGRTLETTGAIAVEVDLGPTDVVGLARGLLQDNPAPTLDIRPPSDDDLSAWVRGLVERLRRDGGIDHEWFDAYKREHGNRYRIWGKRKRDQGMPAFPTGRSAPAFAVVGGAREERDLLAPVNTPAGWYARWTSKVLRVTPTHGANLAARLLATLADRDILSVSATEPRSTSTGLVYGIPPARIRVEPVADDETARLVCDTCRSPLPATTTTRAVLAGRPCPSINCRGTLSVDTIDADNFYRRLYSSGSARRVDAQEHTSLLDARHRAEIETGFKRSVQEPGDPNVLVATPTLEMGIDIGDLSVVMLASLPDSVAEYVQRVGRAGRLTGSSLALAYVRGRGHQLPRLGDPGSLINGTVLPPATYLDAEEIVRRQFLASVMDGIARDAAATGVRTAHDVLASTDSGTLLGELAGRLVRRGRELVTEFAATFPDPDGPALRALRDWVADGDPDHGPAALIHRAGITYRAEVEELQRRRAQVREEIPHLRERAESPAHDDEDVRAHRSAVSAVHMITRQISDLRDTFWVSALELRGLLPTYSLVDDSVRLDAQISWIDPETGRFDAGTQSFDRSAGRALRELAPGASFYARGYQLRIDGLELSGQDAPVSTWALCQECGFGQDVAQGAPSSCPRCGDPGIADTGQRLEVMPLTHVFSDVRRDDARIGDSRDDRVVTRFEVVPTVDFDPERLRRQWSVPDQGLGVAHYGQLAVRWLNLGQTRGAANLRVAGREVMQQGFRICASCGKLDRDSGRSGTHEHRAWCPHRNDPQEHTRLLHLSRELVTEATAFILPPSISGEAFAVPSVQAALMLGLRTVLGGNPAHLAVEVVPHPVGTEGGGQVRQALLLHDTVPGGTGYLADLSTPEHLWRVLVAAAQVLQDCPCQDEQRSCCHRCLLPFARSADSVHRKVALDALRGLLTADPQEHLDDLDGEVVGWHVDETAVATDSGESPLEQHFRNTLRDRLSSRFTVHEEAGPTGTRLRIITPAGAWTLTPQVDLFGTRPDFLLEGPGAPRTAIYTDGHAFHAGSHHNVLADDARKRRTLREHGIRVLAVTYADLHAGPASPWIPAEAVSTLMAAGSSLPGGRGISPALVAAHNAGPLSLLEQWIIDPHAPGWSDLAELTHLLLAQGAHAARIGPGDDIARVAARLAQGAALQVTGERQLLVHRRGHLALVTELAGSEAASVHLVLDDEDEAVADDDHRSAWAEWLRIGNLLTHAGAGIDVRITTTTSTAEEPPSGPIDIAIVSPWPGLDLDGARADELRLMAALTAEGIPVPTAVLDEAEDGVPVTAEWDFAHVRLIEQVQEHERVRLEAEGWTVVEADDEIDSVVAAVRSALLPTTGGE